MSSPRGCLSYSLQTEIRNLAFTLDFFFSLFFFISVNGSIALLPTVQATMSALLFTHGGPEISFPKDFLNLPVSLQVHCHHKVQNSATSHLGHIQPPTSFSYCPCCSLRMQVAVGSNLKINCTVLFSCLKLPGVLSLNSE